MVSPQAPEQLKGILAQFGQQSDILFSQAVQVLREKPGSALSEVFFIAFAVVIVTLIIRIFIKEIPLRSKH